MLGEYYAEGLHIAFSYSWMLSLSNELRLHSCRVLHKASIQQTVVAADQAKLFFWWTTKATSRLPTAALCGSN